MSFKSRISLEELERLRRPGILFGCGLAAGFVLFALWLLFTPSTTGDATASQPVDVAAGGLPLESGRDGVLGDITGGMERRRLGGGPVQDADKSDLALLEGELPPEHGDGALPLAGEEMSEEQALAEGLLPPEDGASGALPLQVFYVEVERDEGDSEIIEIHAESAEHALVIIRDFRGAPAILRGPSLQPLD